MATAWPSTIPQCPMLGTSLQKQTNVVAFTPDVGPPKMRRRSTAAIWTYNLSFKMTSAELGFFNDFYETDLADGSLPFTYRGADWAFDPKQAPQIVQTTPQTFRVSFSAFLLPP